MTRWIISFEYSPVFVRPDGSSSRAETTRTIEIIEKHPLVYLAEAKAALAAAYKNPPTRGQMDNRADDIHAIFFAQEVPDGLLTDEQIDGLS